MSQLTEKQQSLLKAVQDATDELYTSGTPAIYQAIGKVMRLGMLEVALKNANGNQSAAAFALGINRATFRSYAHQTGLLPYTQQTELLN